MTEKIQDMFARWNERDIEIRKFLGDVLVRAPGEAIGDWRVRAAEQSKTLYADGAAALKLMPYEIEERVRNVIAKDPDAIAERDSDHAVWVQREWERRVSAAVLDARPASLVFTGSDTSCVKAVADWIASGSDRSLVLRGGVGTGKSTAAAHFIKHVLRPESGFSEYEGGRHPKASAMNLRDMPCYWLKPDRLVSAVLHSYDPASPRLAPEFVVDDMGRETKADFAEALCEVLDQGKHRMVITTNLTRAQFRERYDLRLVDRMNECCAAFDVPGKSMRNQDGGF